MEAQKSQKGADGIIMKRKIYQELFYKSLCIKGLQLKRQKSGDADSIEGEKDEDLTFLTLLNHKKRVFVQLYGYTPASTLQKLQYFRVI